MKIRNGLFSIGLAVAVITLVGCASQPKMTQEQILSQYQEVGKLESELQEARSNDAELLAPGGYAKAESALDRAMGAARNNKEEAAKIAAADGLKAIDTLNRDAASSRDLLAEVLETRNRAYAAGAKTLQGDQVADLDEDLQKTAALIEKGDIEEAKQRRPKLVAGYAQLELVALKQGTVEQAKSALANAKQQGAKKYASKTFTQAEEELALTVSILDADRTQTDKADVHAKKTKWLAEKSAAITETIKDFDRRDYTMEDVVLWHQQQLGTVNQPLGGKLPFNESSDKAVLSLKNAVSNVMEERDVAQNNLRQETQKSQVRLKEAELQITAMMSANEGELQKLRTQHEQQLETKEKERLALEQKDLATQQKAALQIAALKSANAEELQRLQARQEQQLAISEKERLALEQNDLAAQQKAALQIDALKSANAEELQKLRTQHEQQLATAEIERRAFEQRDLAEQQKFEIVQAMFDGNEAKVYRQRKNILISAQGFQFPTGQSEIQANNFPIMNKITRAIKTFPDARVEVDGHSDSMGNDISNQKLSESRAEKVAKFLKEVGGIAPELIVSRGFGESRPVASNETSEGRAENRRIEVKIINE